MPTRREECRHKHQQVAAFLREHSLAAVVLTRRCNFAWFTAGGLNHVPTAADVGIASLVITPERVGCVTNNIEQPRLAAEELPELDIELHAAPWYQPHELLKLFFEAIGSGPAARDAPAPGLPDHLIPLDPKFNELRWPMTEGEIERYRQLGRDVAECLESTCRSATPGITEHALASRLAAALLDRGIRAPVILMAADERVASFRHPIPTSKPFARYGMAVAGAERHGLTVSATRLFTFEPISDDLKRRHAAVCRVDAEMIAATRPGATLGGVIETARRAYATAGYADEWIHHHQGGSTGYLGREVKAMPGSPIDVRPNQVFAWNPSIAGTKSEDTILVGPDRNEILSATGDWPTTDYPAGGQVWPRCDILQIG